MLYLSPISQTTKLEWLNPVVAVPEFHLLKKGAGRLKRRWKVLEKLLIVFLPLELVELGDEVVNHGFLDVVELGEEVVVFAPFQLPSKGGCCEPSGCARLPQVCVPETQTLP